MINIFKKKQEFWGFLPKHRYSSYGKVKYFNPKQLVKRAITFDLVVPLTFFIPVVLACIVYMFTLGKEFKVTLKHE